MVKHNVEYHLSLASAGIAQQVEQLTCNQQVVGSIPIVGFSNTLRKVLFFYPSEIDGRAVGW